MKKLVSIITPMYNAEKYIEETIKSVLSQTYKNFEMIIVDDMSTDNSKEIIKKYRRLDKRIKYIKNNKNEGAGVSRNVAIKKSKGEYIAFLDSDDLWRENKLQNQIEFMEKNNLVMSHGNYYFIYENRKEKSKIVKTSKKISYNLLLKGNQFKTMTVILKRELAEKVKFLGEKHEDYIYFLQILKLIDYSLGQEEEINSYCRIRKNSVSSNKLRSALWTWKVYRDYEKLSRTKSLYYFVNYIYYGLKKHKF